MSVEILSTIDIWMILPLFLIGSLLHFTYGWSRRNKYVAIFSAVNESYWEHIKIAFWPVFLLAVIEFALDGYSILSFMPAKTIALYSIPVTMIAFVFAYKHFAKKNILILDILAFLLSVALAQVISSLILSELNASMWTVAISTLFFVVIAISFLRFTLHPPKEPDLFVDPLSSEYGLKKQK